MSDGNDGQRSRSSRETKGGGSDGNQPKITPHEISNGTESTSSNDAQGLEGSLLRTSEEHSGSEVIDPEVIDIDTVLKSKTVIWRAPAPAPETLRAYQEIDPTLAVRAFAMAEDSVRASNEEKRVLAHGDVKAVKRGQYMSMFMFLSILISAIIVYLLSDSWELSIGFFSPVVFQFLGKFIRTVRQKEDDKID